MSTYAIGDVQGCFNPLQELLKKINFNADKDTLWFTGDLVNRGPQSLETLRFVKNLGAKHKTVLGNHDLHLLAMAHDAYPGIPDPTLLSILQAPERDELINWLSERPLLHDDRVLNFTLVHAGLCPDWDLTTAKQLASEVELVLQSKHRVKFFQNMYGNTPDRWDNHLKGYDRLRCITNYFTRLRFCYSDGRMDFSDKGPMNNTEKNIMPWFALPNRQNKHLKILFGHWAALNGITHTENVYALDTGCVWGNALTAMRLEDEQRFVVGCK